MKATAVRQKASKVIRYKSKEELMQVKNKEMVETLSKVDPEQLRRIFNQKA